MTTPLIRGPAGGLANFLKVRQLAIAESHFKNLALVRDS
jgi:hypothetical protein